VRYEDGKDRYDGSVVHGADGMCDIAGDDPAGDAIQLILKPRSRCREEAFVFPWRGGFLRPYEGNFETHGQNDFALSMGIMSPVERIRGPVWSASQGCIFLSQYAMCLAMPFQSGQTI